jgi:RimJ/RimL family protein N-acetyltransferase
MQARPAVTHPELLNVVENLEAGSILLRGYRPGDGAMFFAAIDRHRADLKERLAWTDERRSSADTEAHVRRMQAEFIARRQFVCGIWSADGECLGGAGFHALDWKTPKAELGSFLFPPARGFGHATTAVRQLVQLAFDQLLSNRIHATCDADNDASANVMRRAGLREEGISRCEQRGHNGKLRDTLRLGLAIDDYRGWSAAQAN